MAGTKKVAEKEYSPNWGGRRTGQGRPAGSTGPYKEVTRSVQVAVRLTEAEKADLELRAKSAGLTVSGYIHSLAFPDG